MVKIEAFNSWLERWKTAEASERAEMMEEGLRLAQARRAEFKSLIANNPQAALAGAVPRVVRQDLPREIVALLEKPVSATGDYQVYMGRPAPGMPIPDEGLTLRYFETADGSSYKARIFGEMEPVMSRKQIPLRGVAVDRELAVAESPVRQLEIGERIAAGTVVESTCPVSGKTTEAAASNEPLTDETPTIEVGERIITLCDSSHVSVMDEKYRTLVQASGPGGPGVFMDNFPGTSSTAIGNLRCLYIRLTYPDTMTPPNTEDEAKADMDNVARFYQESSYGKLTATTTMTPLVVLPHTLAWYIAKDAEVNGLGLIQSDARAEARKLGYDSSQFNCIIVRVNAGLRSGSSWGGGDSVWAGWGGMDVLNHECGHSLGLNHANYWGATDGTAYGNGGNQEYGNAFDVMGGSGGFSAHYNTISKRTLGWLQDSYVHFPKGNGVYRITAYDQPRLEEGKRYALSVAKDSVRGYNLEYHPARGGQLASSALVLYNGMGSNAGHLLDTTPGSPAGKNDAGIEVGRTFSDLEADMHFTVLSKNSIDPPSLDVAYYRGPFVGNLPPTATLAASTLTPAVGGSVTFTATASDPNGDVLAYHWDFNDGVVGTNSAVFTRTFSSASQVTAMLTVSDMRGGTFRRQVVINVAGHAKQAITGAVTLNSQPLADVLITSGSSYCFTDSNGNYALSGLSTGSQTLAATLGGYTFTPGFTNPLTVVAGTNTANWTASAPTFVTLAKTADATEGGANGTFTLTRTGNTSAALTVTVSPVGGTATKTTDYTFSPDYVTSGSFRTFTIPAGQASLAVAVAAVNDTNQEGPETISLQLASNGTYASATANSVVMTVVDNDTALPQVAVSATDPYSTEAPADPAVFTFSRTGATTLALNLAVTWTGAATNGTDYTSLPATVVIPAGQSSVQVSVSPLNDAAIEGPEDCVATISTNAAYVKDVSATTATATLTDDDSPVITVSVPDGIASEAGDDTALFLISRSGSTAAPLKVYYGLSGTAAHGTDYASLNGEVTIPAGSASAPVIIKPYDDDIGETETETVVLSITSFSNAYSLGALFTGTATIADNDDAPVVSVRAGTTGVEGGANATLIFHAGGSASGTITVNYTLSGTATPGSDYTAPGGSVVISANGSSDVTVTLPVINDVVAESTETIVAKITPSASYRTNDNVVAQVSIRDNDSGDSVTVSTFDVQPTEAGTAARYYLSRTGSTGNLTVNYVMSGTAANGIDYVTLPGSIVIPDTQSGVNLAVTPINDGIAEGMETITLTVVAGAGYGADLASSATFELVDDETPAVTVGFQSATQGTSELPGANGAYRDIPVVLSAASPNTVSVRFTGGGGSATGDDVDWTYVDPDNGNAIISGGTLVFPPGTTMKTLRIKVKNDGVLEGSESAVLELRSPLLASLAINLNKHTVVIYDEVVAPPAAENGPLRGIRFAVASTTRNESDSTEPMLMAILDRPVTATQVSVGYTVGGTATAGSDYQLSPGTLTFAVGEQVKLIPLTLLTDAVGEAPETIVVSLVNPVNGTISSPATHTITIIDSNAPQVDTKYFTANSTMSSGTVLGLATGTPTPGRSLTSWAIISGNTGSAFAISSGGQLTLQTPASLPNPGLVQLVVRVTDNLGSTGDGILQVLCNSGQGLVWINPQGGSWPVTTNWFSGNVATGVGVVPSFGMLDLTADAIVTLDGPQTVGGLVFGDTTPSHNWTIGNEAAGPLTLDASSGTPFITVNSQTTTIAAVIAGNEGLTKGGAGTLKITGAGTWSGTTTVSAGTLDIRAKSGDVPYVIAQGASLIIGYDTAGGYTPGIILNGNGASDAAGLYLVGGKTLQTNNGILIQTQPTTIRTDGSGTANIQGFDTNSAYFLKTVAAASGSVVESDIKIQTGTYGYKLQTDLGTATATGDLWIKGEIVGGYYGGFDKWGTGSLKLTASSTYLFATAINQGSIIVSGGNDRLPVGTTLVLGNGINSGKLILGGVSQTVAGLQTNGSGSSNAVLGGSATMSTIEVANDTAFAFSGKFGGAGTNENNLNLTKSGAGVLTLSAASTLTGETRITKGTLTLASAGSLASPILTVSGGALFNVAAVSGGYSLASGRTLAVQGSVTGPVTIASGATLTVGGATGTPAAGIVTDNLTLAGTTSLRINKTGPTLTNDTLSGVSTLTQGGTLLVTASGDPLVAGDSFTLFGATTFSGSFATRTLPPLTPGLTWNVSQLAGSGIITVAKGAQTVTFGALAAKSITDPAFTLAATASSGLPVSYQSSNPSVASVSGNTVTIHAAGSTSITASQAGNANYNAAVDVVQALVISNSLVVASAQTLVLPNATATYQSLLNDGTLVFGAGTLHITGNATNHGILRLTGGAVLDVAGTFTNTGVIDIINWSGTLPPGLANSGKILDRSAIKVIFTQSSASNFTLSVPSFAGHLYQVETTADFTAPWTPLGSPVPGTGGAVNPPALEFSPSRDGSRRFYRVAVTPAP